MASKFRYVFIVLQGFRKHLKLREAQHFEGTFLLRKRGHFLKIKMALLCLLQYFGGEQVPPVSPVPPVPTFM